MKSHELKTWPEYFHAVRCGVKTFEVRKNDRDFQVGDVLDLLEYEPDKQKYVGRKVTRYVTYVLRGPGFGVEDGYAVLGLSSVPPTIVLPLPEPGPSEPDQVERP